MEENNFERRVDLIGHTTRHEGLLKLVIEKMIEGGGYKGRHRLQKIRQYMADVGCGTYEMMKRKT